MNYKWNYQPPTLEQREAARALAKDIGISPILCRLLLERGITSTAEAKRFFRPQLNELHDPFLMKDMSIAVERLNKAMGRKERIMVYGDYDVDGTTAVALVYKFLQQFYSNIDYYIPDRYISSVWKPLVMWKSVRRAASRSSQYSLLDSSQSMRPYLKAKNATAR